MREGRSGQEESSGQEARYQPGRTANKPSGLGIEGVWEGGEKERMVKIEEAGREVE